MDGGARVRGQRGNPSGRGSNGCACSGSNASIRCIIVIDGKRRFHLLAGGKELNERTEQFLYSFQIDGPR